MEKSLCQCNKCKAMFEDTPNIDKSTLCPGCGHDKVTVLETKDVKEIGCNGCDGCSGCH